ncbi:MAG: O-methyltransferase [Acidimicrobiales bacterium]
MSHDRWDAVDHYVTDLLVHEDDALRAALDDSRAAGLPPINVSPAQGKLLHLLARAAGCRSVLEVGTLGGYSTIWLARALPADGRVVTLEIDPHHAEVARRNLERAGVAGRVDLRLGPAVDALGELEREGARFDLVFVDADKPSNPAYFTAALALTHPGSVIVVDNVVRNGAVLDGPDDDPTVVGTRRVLEMMAAEPRVSATALQTVGTKGYDGFAVALVLPG